MRITNRIMQRNNLSNINTNKTYQDRLSTQMSSQKKINRPSDDPVVAIRALRLRSNVTEISQYYSKNIPDAESWLKVTEDAISNLAQIMTTMIARCEKGVNSEYTTDQRKIILEEMQKLGETVYSTGDADYAGRYVFTGYRTDTSLSFLEAKKQNYTITEQLDKNAIDTVSKVETDKLLDINSTNFATTKVTEDDISSVEVHRIRLAYNDCSADNKPVIEFTDATGAKVTWQGNDITIMHSYDKTPDNPYASAAKDEDSIIYIPETGELLLGEKRYGELMKTKDSEATSNVNEAEIRVTYDKSNWEKGDLRPEHYFYCKADKEDKSGERVTYNENYLEHGVERQVIEYDVGFNQTIRINSTADECFKHGVGREVDDIVNAMQDVLDLEGVKKDIEGIIEKTTDEGELDTLQKQLDAVNKALTLARKKEEALFQHGITKFQGYLDDANLCVTNCGSRRSKLELIENRTQNQKTTYETLKSENEDIDITEVAIQLNAAELTYDAALMAAGKVMQTTLLNFI